MELVYSDPLDGGGQGEHPDWEPSFKLNALRIIDPEAEPVYLPMDVPPSFRINALKMYLPLIPGDADTDGDVDEADAATLAANWQKAADATWEEGDFNGDGSVDDKDATMLGTNWHVGVEASVPEPGTICLILGALGMLLGATFFRRGG